MTFYVCKKYRESYVNGRPTGTCICGHGPRDGHR